MKHFRLLIFLIFYLFNQIKAQDIKLTTYTIEDGLPENTSNVLLQDLKGQIWIGTQAGIAVYDGARFKIFGTGSENSRRLSNNMIEALYQDSTGNILIGTRNGLNIYSPLSNSIKIIMPDTSRKYGDNYIRNYFIEDSLFVYIFSTRNIFRYNKRKIKIEKLSDFKKGSIGYIYKRENSFIVARDSSLYNFSQGKLEIISSVPSKIISIGEFDNNLWIGTMNGIYDELGNSLFTELKDIAILYIKKDLSGKIWIGSSNGIWQYYQGELRQFKANLNNNLAGNLQLDWLQDKNGLIWLGTNAGLSVYNPKSEKIRRSLGKYNFQSISVNTMCYSLPNDLLVIGSDKGLFIYKVRYDINSFITENQSLLLKQQPINYTSSDFNGNIWVGTKSGAVYRINKDLKIEKIDGFVRGIRGFYTDTTTNTTWIAGSEGIFVISADKKIFKPKWLNSINYTVALLPLKQDLLVSHIDSVYRINYSNYILSVIKPKNDEFPSNMITHHLQTDSLVWFSSISGGVFSYNPSSNISSEYHILNESNVWATYSDSLNRLWSSSDAGIFIHNGKHILRRLTVEDGINYNDFKMTAHVKLRNGTLIFGNKKGISIINPNEITTGEWNEKIYISSLDINFKEALTSNIKDRLVLKPNENTLTFKIGISDYLLANDATISYKLIPQNSEWSSFFPILYPISLDGLSSGEYQLLVKVKDKSGRISRKVLSQNIEILPYFYETWWFKIMLSLLIATLIYFLARYQARQKQKAAEMELQTEKALSNERERISRDIHDSIGARLTKIITDLDIMKLKSSLVSIEGIDSSIDNTRDYTQETINNLRETIWTLDTKIVVFNDLLHQTNSFLQRYIPEDIRWKVNMDSRLFQRQISPNLAVNIFRILQELSQNMLKYSKASEFKIEISGDSPVKIIVYDNGLGFDFYSKTNGEGMKNIKKRLDQIDGSIQYKNESGSQFELTIKQA
jgi:signal transduction histidine kinase/ligand-binding sensor domain-containing protein